MKNLQKLIIFTALVGTSMSDKLAGYGAEPINQYGSPLDQYGSNNLLGAASAPIGNYATSNGGDPISALQEVIPGVPGEDYPILAEVPETAFSCEGQVEGGYYADPETECQAFHICAADSAGGLTKYSFLCPNGTIFNQAYFICDWWFNFDCSQAEGLFSKNQEIAAEREAASGLLGSGSAPKGYGAPAPNGYGSPAPQPKPAPAPRPAPAPKPSPSSKPANGGYGAPQGSSNSYSSPQEPTNNGYGAPQSSSESYSSPQDSVNNGYGAPSVPTGNGYGSPSAGNGYGAPTAPQSSYRF